MEQDMENQVLQSSRDKVQDYNAAFGNMIQMLRNDEEKNFSQILHTQVQGLVQSIIKMGDTASQQMDGSHSDTQHQKLIYEWMNGAKEGLILLRDSLFELTKSRVLYHEKELSKEKVLQLESSVLETLDNYHKEATIFQDAFWEDKQLAKKVKKWVHQNNPWSTYKEQFEQLSEQVDSIQEQEQVLKSYADCFQSIRVEILNFFQYHLAPLKGAKDSIPNLINELIDNQEPSTYKKTASQIKKNIEGYAYVPSVEIHTEKLESIVDELEESKRYIVGYEGGDLVYIESGIKRALSTWLDSETTNTLYDLVNLTQDIEGRLSMCELGLRNAMDFAQQNNQPINNGEVVASLESINETLEQKREQISELESGMNDLLEKELRVVRMFEPDFLSVSISSTLNQYQRYQLQGWQQTKKWFRELVQPVTQYVEKAKRESRLSASEKMIRLVRHRTPHPSLKHYTNMFLTKGYIGDSFYVQRDEQQNRIKQLVDDWSLGYRGSLLLSGKRYVGKTSLAIWIKHVFFKDNCIDLKPNTIINIKGRKHEAGFDLKSSLDFLIKYSLQSKPMILIDDLSEWESEEFSVSQNIRSLLKVIDQYSNKFFFVVTMDKSFQQQVEAFFDIQKVFHCEINVGYMGLEEVMKAILIRHNATQSQISNASGQILDGPSIQGIIQQIHKGSEGIIGESLMRWAYAFESKGEHIITPKYRLNYDFPKYLSDDSRTILTTLMEKRKSNEYELRKKFGTVFKQDFRPVVQRLFHLGILQRNLDGSMEINPFLVNDIERILNYTRRS